MILFNKKIALKKRSVVSQSEETSLNNLNTLGANYVDLKARSKEISTGLSLTAARIVALAKAKAERRGNRQTFRTNKFELGVVWRSGKTMDAERLQKLIGEKRFSKVAKVVRVIDETLLSEAVSNGLITMREVQKVLVDKPEIASVYVKKLSRK